MLTTFMTSPPAERLHRKADHQVLRHLLAMIRASRLARRPVRSLYSDGEEPSVPVQPVERKLDRGETTGGGHSASPIASRLC
jgi:hypothetical protein